MPCRNLINGSSYLTTSFIICIALFISGVLPSLATHSERLQFRTFYQTFFIIFGVITFSISIYSLTYMKRFFHKKALVYSELFTISLTYPWLIYIQMIYPFISGFSGFYVTYIVFYGNIQVQKI